MIDFEIMERAFKLAWIKRIIDGGGASWKTINYAVRQFCGVDFLINWNYHFKTFTWNNFQYGVVTVLSYWQEFRFATDNEEISLCDQII